MNLDTQLLLLMFSLFFGIIFGLFAHFNYRFIYNEKKWIRFVFSFVTVILFVLLYFIILLRINYGILHIYSLLFIVIGFFISLYLVTWVVPKLVAWFKKK
ncbi:MAG: hypothetical protein RR847_02025 [Bacilli bacterium]